MRKRKSLVAMIVAFAALVSAGCGGTEVGQTSDTEAAETEAGSSAETEAGSSDEAVTVTWWTWSTEAKDVYEQYAEMVTEKYPNITVKLEFMENSDYWTKLPIAIAGGTGPDIYQMTRPSFELYAASGQVLDLTDILSQNEGLQSNLDAMDDVLVDGYKFQDKQMAIPFSVESTAIVYNKTMFAEAGIQEPKEIEDTWTWDDLRELAQQMTVKGDSVANSQYGFFCATDKIPSWEMILSHGSWIFSDDMETCTVGDSNVVEALTPLVEMYINDQVAPTTDVTNAMSANDLFMTGRIAMMAAGSWNLATFSGIEGFEWDCAELPLDPQTGERMSSSNTLGYVVNPNAEDLDAVGKVLEVFTSPEAQAMLAETGTYIPAVVESRDMYFEADGYPENARAFQRALDYVHPNVLTQYISYDEFKEYYSSALTNAYEGEDLATVLQELEDKVNGIMEENKATFE